MVIALYIYPYTRSHIAVAFYIYSAGTRITFWLLKVFRKNFKMKALKLAKRTILIHAYAQSS